MRFLIITLSTVCLTLLECAPSPKLKFLWIDGSANFRRLSCSDSIRTVIARIATHGFDGIIVDLKPISGEVLYPSKIAPQIVEWKGAYRDRDFNYPEIILSESKKNHLKVYAAVNVFSEGWKSQQRGPIYRNHPEWQTVLYLPPDTLVPTTQYSEGYAAFVNPADPQVQEYEISLMEEILNNYDFDGIVLDRARYDNIRADFSAFSRTQFEKWFGQTIGHWPADIFTWQKDSQNQWQPVPGKLFKSWLEWRAGIIYAFFAKAQQRLKNVNKDLTFAAYTGAWYGTYYELGVNWASQKYQPVRDYEWASPDYQRTGYAELLDGLFSGCYFYHVDPQELKSEKTLRPDLLREAAVAQQITPENTVAGAARLAKRVTRDVVPLYGSLYVQQYYAKNDPDQFIRAIKKCLEETDGVMIFDLVHLEDFGWWQYLPQAFPAMTEK